jgi:DNA modification methylase
MKIGEYELNNIYNEDSYEAIKKIPDKSVDCIYVDIPYLVKNISLGGGLLKNEKRKQTYAKELQPIMQGIDNTIFKEFDRILKKTNLFIWCSKEQLLEILNYFMDKKGVMFEVLVWCKLNPTPFCNNTWLPNLEYCLYFRENGVKLNDGYDLKSKYYINQTNVEDKKLFAHPTIKPLELVKRHLLHTTQENDIVADFFLGSGTTCVAAKELKRRYIGFEIDKQYFKIAKDRLNGINKNGQTSIFTDFEQLEKERELIGTTL